MGEDANREANRRKEKEKKQKEEEKNLKQKVSRVSNGTKRNGK